MVGFARGDGKPQLIVNLCDSGASLTSVALASPQLAIVGDADGNAHVVDTAYGKKLRTLRAPTAAAKDDVAESQGDGDGGGTGVPGDATIPAFRWLIWLHLWLRLDF